MGGEQKDDDGDPPPPAQEQERDQDEHEEQATTEEEAKADSQAEGGGQSGDDTEIDVGTTGHPSAPAQAPEESADSEHQQPPDASMAVVGEGSGSTPRAGGDGDQPEADDTTRDHHPATTPADDARAASRSLVRSTVLASLESTTAALRRERDALLSTSTEQRSTIASLRSEVDDLRRTVGKRTDSATGEADAAREERARRAAAELDLKLERERADRLGAEGDALREEISRLSTANASLTTQLSQIEAESKLSTSSAIPLRFELDRSKKEVDSLTSHSKWLEGELSAKNDDLAQLRSSHGDEVASLRTQLLSARGRSETLESRVHSLEDRNEELDGEVTALNRSLTEQKREHALLMQASQEELVAEKKVSRLHAARTEQLEQNVKDMRREMESLKSLAVEAAEEGKREKERMAREHVDAVEQVRTPLEERIFSLEAELATAKEGQQRAEHEVEAIRQRRGRRRTAGDGSTAIVPAEPSAVAAPADAAMPMSLTDLLDRLADTEDELLEERAKNKTADLYMKRMLFEVEAKTSVVRARDKERELALKGQRVANERLTEALDESQRWQRRAEELESESKWLRAEHAELKQESNDLALQVQSLLKGRTGQEQSAGEGLVAFSSVGEMQEQNRRLVREHRRLQERIADLEKSLDEDVLRSSLVTAEEELARLREERGRQTTLVAGIVQQRDMYRLLLSQHDGKLLASADNQLGRDGAETAVVIRDQQKEAEGASSELSKLRGELTSVRNENAGLEERVARLDAHASNLAASLDKVQNDLLTANGNCARSDAEVAFLQDRCSRLQQSVEDAKAATSRMMDSRKEIEGINSQLQRQIAQVRADASKYEHELRQVEARLRLAEAQAETARQSETRLAAEAETLRSDLSRQGALLESVRRIEASLSARNAEEKSDHEKQIEDLSQNISAERSRHEVELEKLQGKIDEVELKRSAVEQAKDAALKEVLEAKKDAVAAKRDALNAKSELQTLREKFKTVEERLKETEAKLNQRISLSSSPENEKDEKITSLMEELELARTGLANAKERLASYQKVAKANETALAELTKASDKFKEDQSAELERLQKELQREKKASEAKQVALDELGEELSSQRGRQDDTINDLTTKISSLTAERDKAKRDAEAAASRLSAITSDIDSHKADAASAQMNYERELALHSSARTELRAARSEAERDAELRVAAEAQVKALELEMEGAQTQWKEEKEKFEASMHDIESRLKESREQNELLHSQMATLSDTVERLQAEKIDAASSAADAPAGKGDGASASPEDSPVGDAAQETAMLQKTITELRELIRFMRSERQVLDAQVDALKRTAERERATVTITKRSLDEARAELQILQRSAGSESGKSGAEHADDEAEKKSRQTEEQLTLLRESNTLLREESDRMSSELAAARNEANEAKCSLEPKERTIRELEVEKVALEAEKASLNREVEAWKGRVQSLVSKFHPIDPEEHKRALDRTATLEKECASLKSLKDRADQESSSAKALVARLNKETNQLKATLDTANKSLAKVTAEKNAMAKNSSESKGTMVKELDRFKGLANEREKQINSLQTEVKASETRVQNFRKMLVKYKDVIADHKKKEQQALDSAKKAEQARAQSEKKMQELEAVVKEQQASRPVAQAPADEEKQVEATVSTVSVPTTAEPPGTEPSGPPAGRTSGISLSAPEVPAGGFKYAPSKVETTNASADTSTHLQQEKPRLESKSVPVASTGTPAKMASKKGDDAKDKRNVVSTKGGKESATAEAGEQGTNEMPVPGGESEEVSVPKKRARPTEKEDALSSSGAVSRDPKPLTVQDTPGEETKSPPADSSGKGENESALRARLMQKRKLLAEKMKKAEEQKAALAANAKSSPLPASKADTAASARPATDAGGTEGKKSATEIFKPGEGQESAAASTMMRDDEQQKTIVSTGGVSTGSISAVSSKPTSGEEIKGFPAAGLKSFPFGGNGKPAGAIFGSGAGTAGFGGSSSVTTSKSAASEGSGLNLVPPSATAKSFSFGSSTTIKLPLPSKTSPVIQASPFAAFGTGMGSPAPTPFGSGTAVAMPLFGESKKRPPPADEGGSSKQARLDVETEDVKTKQAEKAKVGPSSDEEDGEIKS